MQLAKFAADPLQFFAALTIPSASGPKAFRDVMAEHQANWFQSVAPSLIAVSKGLTPPVGRFWSERTKGGSKDSDCACVLLWLLAFSKQKLDMQVGAADRDQALELKKAAADILRLNGWLQQRIEVQSWSLLCKATGSECTIIPADIAGSHGARPDIVVLNELSHITKEEFAQNLLDNASKKPNGIVIVATNAGFNPSWQFDWREMARASDRWHFDAFSEPAPWLSEVELIEAERRNSRSRFDRLYWGQWVSASGDAIDKADIDACVDSSLAPMGRLPDWVYIAGLDLSVSQDHSALVIVGVNRRTQRLQLAYAESWAPEPSTRKVNLIKIEQTILAMHQRYTLKMLGSDPYQAALMLQRLTLQKVPCQDVPFVGKSLNEMASVLLDVFRSRRIALYNHPQLLADLQRLCIVEKSYGYKLEAPRTSKDGSSVHADLAVALSIALPIAVAEAGVTPVWAGSLTAGMNLTPYQSEMARIERNNTIFQKEQEASERLRKFEHKAEFMRAMLLTGRVKSWR